MRRGGNYLNKHPFDTRAREEYFSAKSQYNRKIKQTKRTACAEGLSNLIKSLDKREMWSLLSDLRGGKKSETPTEMDELHTHLKKILNSPKNIAAEKLKIIETKLNNFLNDTLPTSTPIPPGYDVEFISITQIGKTLKNGKSAFTDGIVNEVIKGKALCSKTKFLPFLAFCLFFCLLPVFAFFLPFL